MYVCMYVRMYVCTYTHTHTYIYINVNTHTFAFVCAVHAAARHNVCLQQSSVKVCAPMPRREAQHLESLWLGLFGFNIA